MNENFLASFGISPESDRIDFNRETGEFKLCGKAKPGSQAYQMLNEAYSMQTFEDKLDKGEVEKEDIQEILGLLEKILNSDIPAVKNSLHDIESLFPPAFISGEEAFFAEDTKEIDDHPWIVESKKNNQKIHVFADFVDYDTYDKEKVLNLFLSKEDSLKELSVKDQFMAYYVIYRSMFEEIEETGIFSSAAKAINHEIKISLPTNSEYCTFRIMLKNKETGEVSVIYFK